MDTLLPSLQRLNVNPSKQETVIDSDFILKNSYPFLLLRYHDVTSRGIEEYYDQNDVFCDEDVAFVVPLSPSSPTPFPSSSPTLSATTLPCDTDSSRTYTNVTGAMTPVVPKSQKEFSDWLRSQDWFGKHIILVDHTQKCAGYYIFYLSTGPNKGLHYIQTETNEPLKTIKEAALLDHVKDLFIRCAVWKPSAIWIDSTSEQIEYDKLLPERRERRPNKRSRSEPSEPTDQNLPNSTCYGDLNIDEEYKVHCLWLRMRQVPCDFNPGALQSIGICSRRDANHKYLQRLTDSEGGKTSDEDDWTPDNAIQQTENWDFDYSVWKVLFTTTPDKEFSEQFRVWKMDDIESQIEVINQLPDDKLGIGDYDPFSGSSFGTTTKYTVKSQAYKSWLQWFMATVSGCVYSPKSDVLLNEQDLPVSRKNVIKNVVLQNDKEGEMIQTYQLEHITPKSWCKLPSILDEFRYITSDPTLLLIVDSSIAHTNQSRLNKPLKFVDTNQAIDNTYDPWTFPSQVKEMASCVARMVIHATMTYPLLSRSFGNGHNPIKPNISDLGIPEYLQQIEAIVKLAMSKPARWEVRIAMQCYARFGCINPLVVSEQARNQFRYPDSYFYKLLKARWAGQDVIARKLIETLKNIT